MKNFRLFVVLLVVVIGTTSAEAQNRPLLTVLNIDSQGVEMTPQQLGNLVRLETEKLDTFEVMDRYDVTYLIKKNSLVIDDCYGKICLIEAGTVLNSEKMLTGSVELYGETMIITLRLIDVQRNVIERSHVREFLNLQNELQEMLRITLYELFDKQVDPLAVERLTKKFQFDNSTTIPNKAHLNLSGLRVLEAHIFMAKPLTSFNFRATKADLMQIR